MVRPGPNHRNDFKLNELAATLKDSSGKRPVLRRIFVLLSFRFVAFSGLLFLFKPGT